MIRALTIPLFLNIIYKIRDIKIIETKFPITKEKVHTLNNTNEKDIIINLISYFV